MSSAASVPSSAANMQSRRAEYVALTQPCEASLLRAARRMSGGDDDLAQDLVQDAIVRGYEAYIDGRFKRGTNARAWLLRILTNNFINQHNRKQKWEAGVNVGSIVAEDAITPDALRATAVDRPDTALLSATLDEPLEAALCALGDESRLCVILVDIEDLDYADAAAALGVPIGTLRTRLFRARAKLHNLLYEYAKEHGHVENTR